MARKAKPLTDTEVKTFKAVDKEVTLFDGGGLELLVKPSGVKIWRYRWKSPTTGKRSVITLGNYPAITLKMARDESIKMVSLVTRGIDPRDFKEQEKNAMLLKTSNTFRKVASDYFELKKTDDIKEATLSDFWGSLELHVFPRLGKLPITELTAPSVINVLKPMADRNILPQLHMVIRRVNEVMIYALNSGLIETNKLADIKAAFPSAKTTNNPTIRPEEVPQLMMTLVNSKMLRQTLLAIEWQLLTLTRPIETVKAMWEDIDLEAKLWTIPASKMKMKREHVIPLCDQAIAILEAMRPLSGHRPYVFPHRTNPNKAMSKASLNTTIRRSGYKDKLTAHGIRALGSTALNEAGFNSDFVEMALSHGDPNKIRGIYNRSQYIEKRREMMTWWGNFIEEASKGSTLASVGNKPLND